MKRLSKRRLARVGFAVAAIIAILAGLALTPARAGVVVEIDKSSQRMAVSVDGTTRYSWPVSTGRRGFGTPSGVFHPADDGAALVLAKILQFADAARDLFLSRFCDSRDV